MSHSACIACFSFMPRYNTDSDVSSGTRILQCLDDDAFVTDIVLIPHPYSHNVLN